MSNSSQPKHTWNHRVVRRYDKGQVWLEITEVHYRNEKPRAFAVQIGDTSPLIEQALDGESDEDLLANFRITLSRMILATKKPILDEKEDFNSSPEE